MSTSEIEQIAMNFGDDLSNAFYYTAQSFIGQTDGGVAAQFDLENEFKSGLGREILITLAAITGIDEFTHRAGYLWSHRRETVIEPLVNDPAELTPELIEQFSPKIADRFLSEIAADFPMITEQTLSERFALPVVDVLDRYLKIEMAFAAADFKP